MVLVFVRLLLLFDLLLIATTRRILGYFLFGILNGARLNEATWTHSSSRDPLFTPPCDRRTLVFIFRGHFVLDELCSSISGRKTNKQTLICAHGKVFICQGCKRLESENYNRLVGMFSLREYLFWFLYLPPSYVPGARLAQLVEHETLTWVRAPRWALRAYFCDLFQSTLCLICSTALNWILF